MNPAVIPVLLFSVLTALAAHAMNANSQSIIQASTQANTQSSQLISKSGIPPSSSGSAFTSTASNTSDYASNYARSHAPKQEPQQTRNLRELSQKNNDQQNSLQKDPLQKIGKHQCLNVSFESKMGPVRDQGNIGWCYANSTADLLTYEFREELDRQRIRAVSAVYVALTFNNSIFRTFLGEGGLDFISVRQALREGFCPQEVEDWIHQQGSPYHIKEKMEYFDWLKRVYDYYGASKVYAELNRIQSSQSILTRIPPRELVRILQDSNNKNVAKNLADYFCQGRRFMPKHYPDVVWRSKYLGYTRQRMISEIHEQLKNSNVVGIAYFADFFSTENLAVGAKAPKTDDGRHMSTIVGSRWNPTHNRCEFKIRNSWGARCSGYKNPEYQKPENCRAGYVWVDQETIRENIYGLTYFDHRPPDQSNAVLFTPVH